MATTTMETNNKAGDLQKSVEHVVRTWKLVNKDALKHGIVFYKRLFTTHPEVIDRFSFSSEVTPGQMEESPGLKRQAELLMTMIDYAVSRLGDPELIPKLKELGATHSAGYNAEPEHYKPVGESLLWTLKEGLGELFTPEVEKAWESIFKIIAETMIEGGKAS